MPIALFFQLSFKWTKYTKNILPEAIKSRNADITLGVSDRLIQFSAKAEGVFFHHWKDVFGISGEVTGQAFKDNFNKVLNSAIDSGNKIKFDLGGLSKTDILEASTKSIELTSGNYTKWELNQILNNKKYMDNTTFYDEAGEAISNTVLKDNYGINK